MRRAALLLAPVLLAGGLTACSGSSTADLPEVSGAFGSKPKITVAKDSTPSSSLESTVLSKGEGPVVKKGDLLVADYLGKVFASGKVFDNSYDRKVPSAFPIGAGKVIKGWDKVLVGVPAGSRVLMVVPPKQGYGATGNKDAGIKGKDSLIFVVDVVASYAVTAGPGKSTPVTDLPKGLPTVSGEPGTEPTVTVAAGTTPPTKPAVTVLSTGAGDKVAKGKLVVVQFAAVDWTGKTLSSSWVAAPDGSAPAGPQAVPVGGPQASPFDLLEGVPAGSRVLMSLPAQTGADASKESVAVAVDVLGVHGPATTTDK